MSFKKYSKIGGRKYAYRVESYRESGKVHQRTLEYLGRVVIRKGQEVIIPPKNRLMGELKVKRVLRYGDVRALHEIVRALDLVGIIERSTVKGGLSPGKLLVILAINRLVDPKPSVRLSGWYEDTALEDVMDVAPSKINPDSVGAALDAICTKTDAGAVEDRFFEIERAIWNRLKELMGVDSSSLIYDLTSTYVYGTTLPLAARGHNRDDNHNEQYNVALAITRDKRLPLHFRVLPGNIMDVSTLRMFLTELKAFGIEGATLVVDRGFYSALNVVEAAGDGYHVIGALPASTKLYSKFLAKARDIEHNAYAVRRGDEIVYLKEMRDEVVTKKGSRTPIKAIAVLSPEKRERDRRRHLGAILRIEESLKELAARIASGEYISDLWDQVKAIRGKYEKCFKVEYKDHQLIVTRRTKVVQRVQNKCGKYVLFSTDPGLAAREILDRYREKDMVEKAFFVLKDVEELQPTRYRLENRVVANVFVCVLGYLLYSVLQVRLGKKLDMSAMDALGELERIQQVVFKTDKTELRQLKELTKKQKRIITTLGMEELFGM